MSKQTDLAQAITDLVEAEGNNNGQRWCAPVGSILALVHAAYPAAAEPKNPKAPTIDKTPDLPIDDV